MPMSGPELLSEHFCTLFLEQKEITASQKRFWQAVEALGFPSPQHDSFRTYPLQGLYRTCYPLAVAQKPEREREEGSIVFLNGHFCPEASSYPKEIICLPLREAYKKYGPILEARQNRQLKAEKNPFTLLNHALQESGLFIYIPPHITLKTPLKIVHQIETDHALTLLPKLALFLGKEAKAQVTFQTIGATEAPLFINAVTDIHLDEGSDLKWMSHYDGRFLGHYFESMRADLRADAQLDHFIASTANGRSYARFDSAVQLLGEKSLAILKGLSLLSGHSQSHQQVRIHHLVEGAKSHQHFKALCDDHAKSQFEGQIFVDPIAQKTEAYQLCNHLLLSERAVAHAKPGLQILADDVKASHGATSAHLDEAQILYLKMRGLDAETAKALLVQAFGLEMLQNLFDQELQVKLEKTLKNWGNDGQKAL